MGAVMARKENISGGGATTNINGLTFEKDTDFLGRIRENSANIKHLTVSGSRDIVFDETVVASVYMKNAFYTKFIAGFSIDNKDRLTKKLLPDNAIVNRQQKIVFIVEKKSQEGAGSVDEKLQTCGFKLQQYRRLLAGSRYTVEYIYLLNDWFRRPEYNDVKRYIIDVGCYYFFDYLPLAAVGLDEETLRIKN